MASTSLCLFAFACRMLWMSKWFSQYEDKQCKQDCSALRFLPVHTSHSTSEGAVELRSEDMSVSFSILEIKKGDIDSTKTRLELVSFVSLESMTLVLPERSPNIVCRGGCGFGGFKPLTQRTNIHLTTA